MNEIKFEIGDRVTCVRQTDSLVIGNTYTVSDLPRQGRYVSVAEIRGGNNSYSLNTFIKSENSEEIQVGNIVTCINDIGVDREITIGKEYEVIAIYKSITHRSKCLLQVKNDNNKLVDYFDNRFIKQSKSVTKQIVYIEDDE